MTFSLGDLEGLAQRILETQPNAVVRVRLLRDVLQRDSKDPQLQAARKALSAQRWVKELAEAQLPDGSWGRFHSQDTKIRTAFPTSEVAIRRALALGLEKDGPVLGGTVRYMERLLRGEQTWTDRVEKSEGWPVCVEAITAATLAQVDPENPVLRKAREYWVQVAGRSFPGGKYDPQAEWEAHRELGGRGTRYLGSRYVLTLLGACQRELPAGLDRRLVDWIAGRPEGIGYLGARLSEPEAAHIHAWLETAEILQHFRAWREVGKEAVEWLWDQRLPGGQWDFGSRPDRFHYFPLSDDWRADGNRSIDTSTRVLALLRGFISTCSE